MEGYFLLNSKSLFLRNIAPYNKNSYPTFYTPLQGGVHTFLPENMHFLALKKLIEMKFTKDIIKIWYYPKNVNLNFKFFFRWAKPVVNIILK